MWREVVSIQSESQRGAAQREQPGPALPPPAARSVKIRVLIALCPMLLPALPQRALLRLCPGLPRGRQRVLEDGTHCCQPRGKHLCRVASGSPNQRVVGGHGSVTKQVPWWARCEAGKRAGRQAGRACPLGSQQGAAPALLPPSRLLCCAALGYSHVCWPPPVEKSSEPPSSSSPTT